jgi:hypothetical protein
VSPFAPTATNPLDRLEPGRGYGPDEMAAFQRDDLAWLARDLEHRFPGYRTEFGPPGVAGRFRLTAPDGTEVASVTMAGWDGVPDLAIEFLRAYRAVVEGFA